MSSMDIGGDLWYSMFMDNNTELKRIIAAAVCYPTKIEQDSKQDMLWSVGNCHANCLPPDEAVEFSMHGRMTYGERRMLQERVNNNKCFMTSTGELVTRAQAFYIAWCARQLDEGMLLAEHTPKMEATIKEWQPELESDNLSPMPKDADIATARTFADAHNREILHATGVGQSRPAPDNTK